MGHHNLGCGIGCQMDHLEPQIEERFKAHVARIVQLEKVVEEAENCLGRIINRCNSAQAWDKKGIMLSTEEDAKSTLASIHAIKEKK